MNLRNALSSFEGTLVLPDGEATQAVVEFGDDLLRIHMGESELGSWPIKYCRVSRTDEERFRLLLDGEEIFFSPDDREHFGVEAARSFKGSSLAERISAIRNVDTDADGSADTTTKRDAMKPAVLVGLLLVAAAVIVGAAFLFSGYEDGVTGTTVAQAPTTLAPLAVDIFSNAPPVFASEWNSKAEELGVPVPIRGRLPTGRFEVSLTPRLILQGTTDDGGNLASLVMSADPRGDASEDQLIMAAWGLAIAVSEPELDPKSRRQLLFELGLDLDNPGLEGLDGELERGDLRYVLRYLPEFEAILFVISDL